MAEAAASLAPFVSPSQSRPSKKEGWPEVPTFSASSPCFRSAALATGGEKWRLREGYVSEGPSESSVNGLDTEDESLQLALPGLERFYETMAAKAQLKPGAGASSSWVLSMARSYRRLSKEKRRRGRLKELLQPAGQASSGKNLACPEHLGWSSNTDDSGYEAGYETDADESELSEWESGSVRQGHKRKLEALVSLTMQMSFSAEHSSGQKNEDPLGLESARPPPPKTLRALGTRPVGLRLSLPNGSGSVGVSESKTLPEGLAPPLPSLPDTQSAPAFTQPAGNQLLPAGQSQPRNSSQMSGIATEQWKDMHASNVSYYDATSNLVSGSSGVQPWTASAKLRDNSAMEVG